MMGNALAYGDAAQHLRRWAAKDPCSVHLCYVDPPFNVGATFAARTATSQKRGRSTHQSGPVAYDDRWGGIDGFLSFLEPSVAGIRELLHRRGQLWLHLDHRAVHEAKVLCDHVFGRGAFRGEVIWAPGNGARGKAAFAVTHQTILVYTKDTSPRSEAIWNTDHPLLREPYADVSLSMHFRGVDEAGRRYRDRTINGKTYRYYADEGRRLGSVWTDVPAMIANTPIHREGTGYPTQKPEKLLERIIRMASNPGDTVCDPMCGSGTTLAVAGRLERRFIGCDASPLAIEIASRRLREAGLPFTVEHFDAAPIDPESQSQ